MTGAPEKIWTWQSHDSANGWTMGEWYVDAGPDGDETSYIRADIHQALEAENERLRRFQAEIFKLVDTYLHGKDS